MKNTKNNQKQSESSTSKRKRRKRGGKQSKTLGVGYGGGQREYRGPVHLVTNRADTSSTFSPNSLWEFKKASSPAGMRIRGRELFAQSKSDTTGTYKEFSFETFTQYSISGPLNGVAIHPIWFPRLGRFAELYDFYKFHSLKFTLTTTLPFTNVGTAVYYIESDPTTPATGQLSIAASQLANCMGPAYSDMSLGFPQDLSLRNGNGRYKTYWPSGQAWNTPGSYLDPAMVGQTVQGILYGGSFSLTLPGPTDIVHTVMAEYDVEFYVPTLESSAAPLRIDSRLSDKCSIDEGEKSTEKLTEKEWLERRRSTLRTSKCSSLKTG